MAEKSLAQPGIPLAHKGSGKAFELGVARLVTLAVQMQQQCRAMGLGGSGAPPWERAEGLREGEAEAIARVLDVVDAHPGLLQALTAQIDAESELDPTPASLGVVSLGAMSAGYTAAARAALARAADLAPVVAAIREVLELAEGGVDASASTARSLGAKAYVVAREKGKTNRRVASSLRPATDFFEGQTRKRGGRAAGGAIKATRGSKRRAR